MSAVIPIVAGAIPVVQQAVETDLTITEKILELIKSMNCNSACCGSEKIIITPITPVSTPLPISPSPIPSLLNAGGSLPHHN